MHRGISPKVLRYCLNEGILIRPRAATTATAFLWARMKAAFRSAFQRGCQGTYRGDVTGSQKKYGFLMQAENPDCDTVELYEAPIDASVRRDIASVYGHCKVAQCALSGAGRAELSAHRLLLQHPQVKSVCSALTVMSRGCALPKWLPGALPSADSMWKNGCLP